MSDAPQKKTLISAKWIAPMDQPILRDAAIVFDGEKIVAIGSAKDLIRLYPRVEPIDLPNSILLPGLINAHTHLELSNCVCGELPASFTDWILSLPQRHTMDAESLAQLNIQSVRAGIDQCLRFGVTCVGDISQFPQFSRPAMTDSPLRAVSYAEALGIGSRRARFQKRLEEIHPGTLANGRITFGISPHAPYTVDLSGYGQCLQKSQTEKMPLATHLSEWSDETEFLLSHTGMFRDLYDRLGFSLDAVETFPGAPIRFAHSIGLLQQSSLLAHVNYCDDAEIKLLAAGRASVVYCPRTHQYFRHPPHRWRDMLAAGINVAVGTDSCASSPDLNLLAEVQLLRKIAPEVPAQMLWQMITTHAAAAVTLQDRIGSLSPGKFADVVAFRVESDEPLEELLYSEHRPARVWIGGVEQREQARG